MVDRNRRVGGIVNALYCPWNANNASRRSDVERYSREIGVRESFINPHPDLGGIISSRISDVITLRTD